MKSKEQIEKELARLKADERLSYPPASVFSNAPLALVQVELAAKVNVLAWVLLDMDDSALEKATQQMREADALAHCRQCGALIETDVHCDNCGTFHPTRAANL